MESIGTSYGRINRRSKQNTQNKQTNQSNQTFQKKEKLEKNEFPLLSDDLFNIQEYNIHTKNQNHTLSVMDDVEILDVEMMDIKMAIEYITPGCFPPTGGKMTIRGKNFGKDPKIYLSGNQLDQKNYLSVSDDLIEIIIPPMPVGDVSLLIVNEYGQRDKCDDVVKIFNML